MNKTLLINRINPQNFTKQKKRIFFLIGSMNVPEVEDKLVATLNNSGLDIDDIVYKYNGVELYIDVQMIPIIVKLLSAKDLDIYSVHEIYDPEF
ncbi:MAG: hypothetical protein PHY91_03935 [Tissierellia bacterium]|nr:hypothetical protein [Tissierellia bacterium]